MLEGFAHQGARHLPAHSTRGCQPAHRLAITAVQTEQHLDRLAVPAPDREHVRTPTQITLERHHYAVMATLAPAARAWQQQLIDPHDAIDPLMVNPCAALAVELSV